MIDIVRCACVGYVGFPHGVKAQRRPAVLRPRFRRVAINSLLNCCLIQWTVIISR